MSAATWLLSGPWKDPRAPATAGATWPGAPEVLRHSASRTSQSPPTGPMVVHLAGRSAGVSRNRSATAWRLAGLPVGVGASVECCGVVEVVDAVAGFGPGVLHAAADAWSGWS